MNPDADNDQFCVSSDRCHGYDHLAKHPAYVSPRDPLCEPCLAAAGRDIRTLMYDYIDLEQQQTPVLSQALDTQPAGKPDPPMPLKAGPEALQREIVHVLTTWEEIIRAECGLSQPDDRPVPIAAWNTTITRPPPPAKVRDGAAVQRAVGILLPRLRLFAGLGPQVVYPTGFEDQITELAGWQAIHHLQQLRARARSMLGWTRRTPWIPGDCWNCDGRDADDGDGPLYRAEPRYEGEDTPVRCNRCDGWRPYEEHERYQRMLIWPDLHPAEVGG